MRAVIGAISNLDGEPVGRSELESFAARARLPWGGRPRVVAAGSVGLIWIPAQARVDSSDSHLAAGRLRVVLDGTIDNRVELARELSLDGDASGRVGSERVVAAAYERWGEDCPARLIGEFAFLLWDEAQRWLFGARDAFGLRELFHVRRDRQIRIASQLPMLLRSPSPEDLDEEYVADFLVSQVSRGEITPFKAIRRLPASHALRVGSGGLSIRRYWDPTQRPTLRHRSAEEAAEHFLDVFREGVDRSMSTGGRVWAELSGGLDSSAIVCLAQEILRDDPDKAPDFATVSLVWPETPHSDERPWVRAMVEKYGLDNHQIPCDDLFFDGCLEASRYRNEPHFGILCDLMYRAEGERLHAEGVETLLSGARAESVILADLAPPVHLADHLRRLRFGAFWRDLVSWQNGSGKPLANLAITFALAPLLRRDFYVRSSEDQGQLDPWIDQGFARRLDLRRRARSSRGRWRTSSIAERLQLERLDRSEQMIPRGFVEWCCEHRHPFLYRPLVELVLEIPWEQKVSPTEGKTLLRRSHRDLLPEVIRTRQGGLGPGPAAYKTYAKRWDSIEPVVRSSLLVEMGYLDRREFTRAAELVRFGASPKFGAFTACLAFEYWLRALLGEGGAPPGVPST